MKENLYLTVSNTDPYRNLALEELLLSRCREEDGALLYLWQNDFTVVIGLNQNAWRECRVTALEADGGRLARRTTGGGAVFHDMGNLNFSFIAGKRTYDVPRQLSVIVAAVNALGIDAAVSGRNDIVTGGGAKFSGNAFRNLKDASLHHGTLLINADMDRLSKYLAPSREKLAAKGIKSVRSRVANLSELAQVTVSDVAAALKAAFLREYGKTRELDAAELACPELAALCARHASYEWRLGKSPACDVELSHRFEWGELQLMLSCEKGIVARAYAYSDAMDADMIQTLPGALTGRRLDGAALAGALPCSGAGAAIADWLKELSL